ncbi:AGE family epimerase/isomerase [uncultured Algibacter sp.]|uniref:AGE family epimerase/isomerase n=1 Tax=uncultured Algibacter sp. TaxID=298659 RepID=UPI00260A4F56|nr:AGE family epimerase/isomerase [uncultured Algibacter sp.]
MKKISIIILAIPFLMASCHNSKKEQPEQSKVMDDTHEAVAKNLIGFFNKNAYQNELETYLSEVDNTGKVMSNKVYNVALSRLIYGLSYASVIDTSYLDKAKNAMKFQMDKLVAQDSIGGYFNSFVDAQTNETDGGTSMDVWQQSYGLCGLSELYRNQPNEALLSQIHKLHDGFTKRFHDENHGGFYGNYDSENGKVSGSKSLQSLMYPITAYMENLWLADTANRQKYEPFLKENLELVYKNAWNSNLGWVNIKFDDEWNACKHESAENPCFKVTPGHNFQLASLLLRTKNWGFLTLEEREKYQKLGIEILTATLKKQVFPNADLSQGFYSEVNPVSNEVTDKRKTWWQHCEALIALSLADGQFEKELEALESFYFSVFPDKTNGGEYFFLDENNTPQTDELKGGIGKSTYHTIEMIRFLNGK